MPVSKSSPAARHVDSQTRLRNLLGLEFENEFRNRPHLQANALSNQATRFSNVAFMQVASPQHALRECVLYLRAFQNGRAIAKAGAPEAMLAAMRDHLAGGAAAPQIPTAICNALRRIAVNDDICKDFADAGGVTVTMQVKMAIALM